MRSLLAALLVGLALGLSASAALIAISPSNVDFSLSNRGWNGLSWLREGGAESVADSSMLAELEPGTTLLILSPSRGPSTEEAAALRALLASGGTLVIANDLGYGNDWLKSLGLCEAFLVGVIRDPLLYEGDTALPRAFSGDLTVVLNVAVALDKSCLDSINATILLVSSPFSYVDLNLNGEHDPEEPEGPFAVVARAELWGGTLMLLGDPSLMINSMINYADNLEFVEKLVVGNGKPVVYEAILDQTRLMSAKATLERAYSLLDSPEVRYGLVSCLTIAAAAYGRKMEALVASLRRRPLARVKISDLSDSDVERVLMDLKKREV